MNNPRMQNCNHRCAPMDTSSCMEPRGGCRNTFGSGYPRVETAKDMVVAMAYVPWQYFGTVYEPDKALRVGTIFPELNKPYVGCRGGRCNE